ncbi:putative ATP-grasp-modified RiPP [Actinocorallia sp. API 0066]|uniref:putative ATP-grasp-modified RiPP n=1 Tax=Actinocorallia sp. API 0066 TaxID=2896846 RepID=UPI001E5578C2|nr:putative ATP-grasp-modified RiPP [Actinocorallia sp. API 0066]MCD0452833.1 putative ATP-grasp-modified RiPP [Actinocorallia sp. API 0066]
MFTTTEPFPLRPSERPPSDPAPAQSPARPWLLRFARTCDGSAAAPLPPAVYDPIQQISVGLLDPGLLPYMQTNKATVQDGDPNNPPPLDEGAKD